MNTRNLNSQNLADTSLIDYLEELGHHPARGRGHQYWYLSPLRKERTPSFHVDPKRNLWYDFGTGEGGNFVQFVKKYFGCRWEDWVERYGPVTSAPMARLQAAFSPRDLEEKEPSPIQVIAQFPLSKGNLVDYLKKRAIPLALAQTYCQKIKFRLHGKIYEAIAMANASGGFELRNAWFKASTRPKACTWVEEKSRQRLLVFEGMFDFLSYRAYRLSLPPLQKQAEPVSYLILHSLAFFDAMRPRMDGFAHVDLFLDADAAGQAAVQRAEGWSAERYHDCRSLFEGFKDLNEWWQRQATSRRGNPIGDA